MRERIVINIVILLLLAMPVSGILNNLSESSNIALWINRFFRLINIPLLLILLQKTTIKKIIKERLVFFSIVIAYYSFFYYHTVLNPPLEVKGIEDIVINEKSSGSLLYHLLFGLSLSLLMLEDKKLFDIILAKIVPLSTIANSILMIVMLIKHGVIFLLVEALSFNGVTLIVFSYQIIFTLLAIAYLWKLDKQNKSFLFILALINIALLLSMGKRGPLLSILMVVLCLWLLHKVSIKKTIAILAFVIVFYNIVIDNIEMVLNMLTTLNSRLGSALADFYYYGDLNGRETLHEYAYEQIDSNPFWGSYPGLIYPADNEWCFGYHPHNIWLEAIMTMGYIGSIPFFIYIIYTIIFKVIPSFSENNAFLFFSMLFIAEVTHGFMSGTLGSSDIWLSLFVLSVYKKNNCIKSYGGR